jgi:flagellum-specific ATP synthase
MQALVSSDELKQSNKLRRLWSLYQQNADLVQVGAYEAGSNPELDEAIRLREQIVNFLRQDMDKGEDYAVTRAQLQHMLS